MKIGLAGTGRIGAFHARTLTGLDAVDELVLFDVVPESAAKVADALGASVAHSVEELLGSGIDGFVITTGTHTHADLLKAGLAAGVPTFCEKPVSGDLEGSIELARLVAASDVPVHIGFQRRFDRGYRRLREAVQGGELGFVHSIRAATHDQSPPHPSYIPTSGGLFRDCSVHDFDILRFVTGREVRSVYAVGANKGEKFFTEGGDVDSAAAVLTMDDDTLVIVSATRYNGGGHDIRMEVHGSQGAMAVGLDDSLALRSAEPGVQFPPGPQHWSFMERFEPAYRAELTAFADVARGAIPSPCTVSDALQAFRTAEACDRSLKSGQPVALADIAGA
ncbi:MAG: Gfo/Idh/MocA family oxidoreductase [Actinobacteria bacterium]|nr:Gfo/Idh/MocA family oxidoreductase [Actinomycetota bacterium]